MTGWHVDDLPRQAQALDDAATGTAAVVARLATAWADEVGRGWAERLRAVVGDLEDAARAAADLSARTDRHAGEPTGVVLGAQTGTRTTGRRGVVVPTLPPP